MHNRTLGTLMIVIAGMLLFTTISRDKELDAQLDATCEMHESDNYCPHREKDNTTTYLSLAILGALVALGVYMIFFEKSQKEIIRTLKQQKHNQIEQQKFDILLMALDEFEQKVIKAVKEQDGITQQTLRLRTDMHKSKLSITLDQLEKKNLITRQQKGKTKQVFLKIDI